MFYSQFILAKKGPLGTIWIAAHLERKLRKNQVADTDIGVSVDSILSPDVPIALRLSSHLLLGVVRIYNRKVNYLFDDCSEALLKIKQAFRSAAVDLPPEESKAPYHSITLPETFDLDDFELPDNDIFQGNFVDHHISSREQITLQDTMEGVSYSTSKFGLDERFGDGDASGLDLDEELFLDKIGTAGHVDERSAPQTSVGLMAPLKQDEHPETSTVNSGTRVDDVNDYVDLMDYAHAPCTPGLAEEPNLSNVQEVSACDDHLESEYHVVECTVTESAKNNTYGDKQEVGWSSRDNTDSDAIPMGPNEEYGYLSGDLNMNLPKTQGESPIEAKMGHISGGLNISLSKPLGESPVEANTEHIDADAIHQSGGLNINLSMPQGESPIQVNMEHISGGLNINLSKPQEESPIEANMGHISMDKSSSGSKATSDLLGQIKTLNPTPELTAKIIDISDIPCMEDLQYGPTNTEENSSLPVDKHSDDRQGPYEIGLEKSECEISGLTSTCHRVFEGVSVKDQGSLGFEVPGSVEIASDSRSCPDASSDLASKNQGGAFPQNSESLLFHEPVDSSPLNLDVREKIASTETPFLRPCNSNVVQHDIASGDADVKSDVAVLATSERETTVMLDNSEGIFKENHIQEHISQKDVHEDFSEPNNGVRNGNSHGSLVEHLNESAEAELPAPEKLLSVPEGHADLHRNMLVEGTPGVFVGLDEGDAGSKIVSGKKRSFTESTLTEQSLNSVESSRLVRFKRTVESVPDDDDLLSSILVGRSSVLKVKPTPRLSEVTSMKRTRSAPRTGAPKRKVLMDDTMVLHGDTIRQQLTMTEDIRRVRKKAPCTRPEISVIQKQYLEDGIFLQPAFTGMSIELVSLHSQMRDLSGITVCKSDLNDDSLQIVAEMRLPSENVPPKNVENVASLETLDETVLTSHDVKDDENVASLETLDETVLASHDVKNDDSHATAAEQYLTSLNVENDESLDRENVKGSASPNVTGQNGVGITSEFLLDRDSEVAECRESPLRSNNRIEEVDEMNIETNISKEQIKPSIDVEVDLSQRELLLDVTGVETSSKNDDAGVESLYTIGEASGDMGDASAGMVQIDSITETSETNPSMNASTTAVLVDQNADVPSVGLDSAVMYFDNGQALSGYGFTQKDGDIATAAETEPIVRDDILSDMARDGATIELLSNVKHGELEYNEHSEFYNVMSEQHVVASSYPGQVGGLQEDDFMNNGENPEHPEAYQRYMLDGESSGFDLHNQEEMEYSAAGDDTEFLNVDDDDLTELADDHIPDDDEARFTETTGWSSRTRAVSKYLQTLFVKEAERGRDSLSMNNLLIGKSRKEASRMFFEALVLKTRDNIHVEQQNPFDDITIKPRARLMKYDF